MDVNELISVVVPIYNVENYLEDCLNSILNQSYKNIEVILVNDGSTDNSLNICEKYMKTDTRVKLINKKNGGLSEARNYGINQAKGRYITFIDSDDIVSHYFIETLYNGIINEDADISMCGYKRFNNIMKLNLDQKIEIKFSNYSNEDILNKILLQQNQEIFTVSSCGKLYKKEIFNNLEFPVGKLNEDLSIIVNIIYNCKKINVIENYLYFYRINQTSITLQKFTPKRMDLILACENVTQQVKEKYPTLLNSAIVMMYSRAVELYTIAYQSTQKDDYIFEKNKLISIIKGTRKAVLFEPSARKKARISAGLAYININFVAYILKKIRKHRYK